MKYIFQSGRLNDTSRGELISLINIVKGPSYFDLNFIKSIGSSIKSVGEEFFTYEGDLTEEEAKNIFNRSGGLIRLCEIIDDTESFLANIDRSVDFGVSFWGYDYDKSFINNIKNSVKQNGHSARFILPDEENVLNAAQIIKNKIIEKGFELCVIKDNNDNPVVAKTVSIQNIDEFSKRDYERPYVDKIMGVLPPKLARIMINIANIKPGATIWDPFCGSGTVLSEGLILGYNVIGTDKDENAVFFSQKNIEWLEQNYNISKQKYAVKQLDVMTPDNRVIKELKNTILDAVICEPFMGPPQKRMLDMKKAQKLSEMVLNQYKSLVYILRSVNFRKGRVVIVVPAYKTYNGWVSPRLTEAIPKNWEHIDKYLAKDLQWKRSNSIIMRKLFVFDMK